MAAKTGKTSTGPGTGTSTGDGEAGRIVSIKNLADTVDELVKLVKNGSGGGSINDQVTRAVQAAKEQEAAQNAEAARQKAIDDRLKSLEDRTERRPTERSRLSRFMWGGDE